MNSAATRGRIWARDEVICTVYGMPKVIADVRLIAKISTLVELI